MFFGCRASGEKNGVKSNIINALRLLYHIALPLKMGICTKATDSQYELS